MKVTMTSRMGVWAALLGLPLAVAAQQPAPGAGGKADQVAALKQSLAEGTKKLAQYEWVETTAISLKGEEKSRKQNRCFYGADGKVQKVAIAGEPKAAPSDSGGGRGRKKSGGAVKGAIVENKKEDIQEYMKQAVALVQSYVPPQAAKIQAVKDAGGVSVNPQGAGVRIEMKQYLKPGDVLSIDLDPAAGRLLGLNVSSYIEKPDEPVTLAVQMATLPDGALYAAKTVLDAKAKNIQVVITNSGHRPVTK
jgi:hypothetical protein